MIGLDTNVLVRYIMQDDAKQSPRATKLIEALSDSDQGYITQIAVIELVWVLSSCYELNREQLAQALDAMLRTRQFLVERADQVIRALRVFKSSKADFADCLIERTAASAGCNRTVTFDVGAVKHVGMTLVP